MNYKYLPVILLLASQTVNAQNLVNPTQTDEYATSYTTNPSEPETYTTSPEIVTTPARASALYSGRAHEGTVYLSLDLGGGVTSSTKSTGTGTGTAGITRVDIGYKFMIPTRNSNSYKFFSLGAGINLLNIKDKYTIAGIEGNTRYDLQSGALALSYSQILQNSSRKIGFYWQAGMNVNVVAKTKLATTTFLTDFRKIYPDLIAHFGMTFRFKPRHLDPGTMIIGPFASYVPINLTKESNASISVMCFGLKIAYLYQFGDM